MNPVAPLISKLTNDQPHYIQVCAQFHLHRSTSVGSTAVKYIRVLQRGITVWEPIFRKTHNCGWALHGDHLYQISTRSVKINEK